MENRRDFIDPSDPEVVDIMRKKKLAKILSYVCYGSVGLMILLIPVLMLLDLLNLLGIVCTIVIVLSTVSIFGSDRIRKDALIMQRELGIEKTPDEIEAERKEQERIEYLFVSPEEMDQEFKKLATIYKIGSKLLLAGVVLMGVDIVVAIVESMFPDFLPDMAIVLLAVLTIIGLFPGAMIYAYAGGKQKKLSIRYTPGVLSEAMDRLEKYEPYGSVDQKYMWEDFQFGRRDRIGTCADYVKGVIRGMPVEFCEFEIQCESTTTDSNGKRKKEIDTTFTGLMALCRHGFNIPNNVTMTQFSRYFRELKTESVEFTRAWSIKEDSGLAAFIILTPQYMEGLMATIREKGMRMGLQFRTDGVLVIVLQGANFFEVDEAEKAEELKEKIRKEIKDIGDIMENVGALTETEIEAVR